MAVPLSIWLMWPSDHVIWKSCAKLAGLAFAGQQEKKRKKRKKSMNCSERKVGTRNSSMAALEVVHILEFPHFASWLLYSVVKVTLLVEANNQN